MRPKISLAGGMKPDAGDIFVKKTGKLKILHKLGLLFYQIFCKFVI